VWVFERTCRRLRLLYLFDDYVMDVGAGSLRRSGLPLPLTRQCFEVLRHLAENGDRAVDEQELLRDVWQTRQLAPGAVRKTVSKLRRALGADHARLVHTLRGDGYRMGVPVRRQQGTHDAATLPFVGRGPVLDRLLAALGRAQAGQAGLVLVEGGRGLGKTRCLDELAALARRRGASAWRVTCVPDTFEPPALWPWAELLRAAVADGALSPRNRRPPGSAGEEAARAWLDAPAAAPAAAAASGPAQSGFAHLERLLALLRSTCERQVRVLLLDDLHAADAASLECLRFIVSQLRDCQLLIVATLDAKPARAGQRPIPAELLQLAESCVLEPFTREELASYAARLTGGVPIAEGVLDALLQHSAGAPRRLEQLVASLLARRGVAGLTAACASDVQLPTLLETSPLETLVGLEPALVEALEAAALLTQDVDVALLGSVGRLDAGAVLRLLDWALERGVLARTVSASRFGWCDLRLRDALRARLTEHRRRALHLAIGEALAWRAPSCTELAIRERADHLHAALPLGAPAQALSAALEAARSAELDRAPLASAAHLAQALEACEWLPEEPPRSRARLTLARARALLQGGEVSCAMGLAGVALEQGRAHDLHHLVVDAGRMRRYAHGSEALPDEPVRLALERVLEVLPESSHALRGRALATLARTPPYSLDCRRALRLAERAAESARQAGDPFTLAEAAMARIHALGGPDRCEERLAAIDAVLKLDAAAELTRAKHHAPLYARAALLRACLERDDSRGAAEALARHGELATRTGAVEAVIAQRAFQVLLGAHRSGDYGRAQQAYGGLQAESPAGCMSAALNGWRVDAALRGEDPELAQALQERTAASFPELTAHPLHDLSWLYIHLVGGRHEPARALLERYARHDFEDLAANGDYLYLLCALVPAAVRLEDRPRRAQLKRLLQPHAGRHATSSGLFDAGPVSEALAQC
jgi:DNA-binding winged helix-turn-helix (wHTH) protein